MKLHLFDTINRYLRYSETLDVKTKICTDRGLSSIMEARTSKVHIKETRDHLIVATRTDEVYENG